MRTFPDYGALADSVIQPDIDLTELAARMGALETLNRTGRVIYADTLQNLAPWYSNNVDMVYTPAFRGEFSPFFNLTGAGSSAALYKAIPFFDVSQDRGFGVEFKVAIPKTASPAPACSLSCVLERSVGHGVFDLYRGGVRVNITALPSSAVEYLDASNTWQTLESFDYSNAEPLVWNLIKFVYAPISAVHHYRRLVVNQFYQTNIDGGYHTTGNYHATYIRFDAASTPGGAGFFISDFILTAEDS
jgi:hypothetical protein